MCLRPRPLPWTVLPSPFFEAIDGIYANGTFHNVQYDTELTLGCLRHRLSFQVCVSHRLINHLRFERIAVLNRETGVANGIGAGFGCCVEQIPDFAQVTKRNFQE